MSFDAYKLESAVDRNPPTRPIREQRFRLDQLAPRSRPALRATRAEAFPEFAVQFSKNLVDEQVGQALE